MPSRHELNVRARNLGIDPASYPNDSKLEQLILWASKNTPAITGTVSSGTLTVNGDLTAGDQVLVGTAAQGGKTYTFVTALSEVKATGLLTLSDVFSDGETVSIEGYTYTFRTALSTPTVAFEVLIGVSAAVSLDNLKIAINDTGGTEGTEYSVGTYAHPLVTATTNAATTQLIEAREFGTKANSFRLSESCANAAWGAPFMGTVVTSEVAGVANVPNEVLLGANAAASLDNLKLAINNSATEGTQYSTGTKAHGLVTATTNTDTTQVVESRVFQVGNASISTTDPVDTGTHLAWGATTLASGVAKIVAVPAANASGVKATNEGLSGDKNTIV